MKINDKAKKKFQDVQSGERNSTMPQSTRESFIRGEYFFFGTDMKMCCMQEIADLRKEALRRLGPPVKDEMEQRAYERLLSNAVGLYTYTGPVVDYAPYLEQMGEKLKMTPDSRQQ